MMQSIALSYAKFFNARHGRTGTPWGGRYRSTVIDTERYFMACSRYIELNPVRASMVESPADYRWSSCQANCYGTVDAIITPHALYNALGASTAERQMQYRSLFQYHVDSVAREGMDERNRLLR